MLPARNTIQAITGQGIKWLPYYSGTSRPHQRRTGRRPYDIAAQGKIQRHDNQKVHQLATSHPACHAAKCPVPCGADQWIRSGRSSALRAEASVLEDHAATNQRSAKVCSEHRRHGRKWSCGGRWPMATPGGQRGGTVDRKRPQPGAAGIRNQPCHFEHAQQLPGPQLDMARSAKQKRARKHSQTQDRLPAKVQTPGNGRGQSTTDQLQHRSQLRQGAPSRSTAKATSCI